MMEDLIIIIPTHNRQHYLRRVIKYYSEFPCKVYICDSSKEKADVESSGNIIYRWVPQSNFYGKVLDVLNETSADFYALSPDDDFLKQETLMECYEALKENEEYSFGTGKQVSFKEGFKEGFYTIESANKLQGISKITFESREAYIKYFWEHYQNILWSIFRKDVIKAAFTCLSECNFSNGNFVELTLGIEGMRRGKVYLSSNGLNFREHVDSEHWGNTTPSINHQNIRNNDGLKKDLDKFAEYFSGDEGFANNCLLYYLGENTKRLPLNYIKSFFPLKLKEMIKELLQGRKNHNSIFKIPYTDEKMFIQIKSCIFD